MKFEPGYTPANLRALIVAQGWTQKQAAEALGVTERTLRNWLTETDTPSHTDMPLVKWRQALTLQKT